MNRKNIYDINYLLKEDIDDKKPNLDKLEKLTPYLVKDKALTCALFSVQNVPDQVREHYKNSAIKSIEDYNKRFAHLLEIMETKDYSK